LNKNKILNLIAVFLILLVLCVPLSFAQSLETTANQQKTINFEYDDNGNLVLGVGEYYVYNSLNQLVEVKENNVNGRTLSKYYYDESGQRIKKVLYSQNGNSKTTYYVSSRFIKEKDSNQERDTIFYYEGSSLAAEKDYNDNIKFYHPNHLGSTHIVTDEDGEVIEETTYKPFGLPLEGGESRYTFTGQEKDKESSLMYYNARYYSPFLRHFTQPDTTIPDVYDPQSLNRYSYARNNPVKYVDSTGHFWHILFGAAIGAVIGAGYSVIKQIYNGASLFDSSMDWGAVGKSALIGGAAGAVGAATFGIVSPVFTGATGVGYLAGTTSTYAASSAMGSAAAQATSNVMSGAPITENLLEATSTGAQVGGAIGLGVGSVGLAHAAITGTPAVFGGASSGGSSSNKVKGTGTQEIPIKRLRGTHPLLDKQAVMETRGYEVGLNNIPEATEVWNLHGREIVMNGMRRTARSSLVYNKNTVTADVTHIVPKEIPLTPYELSVYNKATFKLDNLINDLR